MIKSKFTEISNSLGGEYFFSETRGKGITDTYHTTDYHKLIIPYKESEIIAIYEFGNRSTATITTKSSFRNIPISFNISKRNHFFKLFNKNTKSLKVSSQNKNTQIKIEDALFNSGLEKIASDTVFEPMIKLSQNKDEIEVFTIFYLGFQNKENSILPIINFYKDLIDLINRS